MKYLRLKKKKDFQRVLKVGKRVYSGALTVVYIRSQRTAMAVCVGKRFGKSVQRNRIKRLLREAFRCYAERIVPCVVLLMPKEAKEYSYATYRKEIGAAFAREKLFLPEDRGSVL